MRTQLRTFPYPSIEIVSWLNDDTVSRNITVEKHKGQTNKPSAFFAPLPGGVRFPRPTLFVILIDEVRGIFTARAMLAYIASAVLATTIPSVCPSICPSVRHTPVLCQYDGT